MASFEENMNVLREAGQGVMSVALATNQENGVVSYATGALRYHKPFVQDGLPVAGSERLETEGDGLKYLFSDVEAAWPAPAGSFGGERQPFATSVRIDRLGLMIRPRTLVATFTLHSWNDARFTVSLERRGDVLIGVGNPIGGGADSAFYVLSGFEPGQARDPR